MASKYQTPLALGDSAHANFRVNRFTETDSLAVKPSYQFTLTPYSYIYLNVKYGGAKPVSVRVKKLNEPTPIPYSGTSEDIINVGSAAALKDLGDLSALYPHTASVANARRIKKLKLGNDTIGYTNTNFAELTTGENSLLEELDLTNITSYDKALDLKKLVNLKTLKAFGTQIPSISFAEGGKINYVELPAVTVLTLTNLKHLSTDKLKITVDKDSNYFSITDLNITGSPSIDQLSILEKCINVINVKLDNVNFGTKTYEYFENNLFKLKGIDDGYANAQLTGTVHFENLDGAQYNEIASRYPNLKITYDSLESIVKFYDTEGSTVISEQTITGGNDCIDPVKPDRTNAPTKTATDEFSFIWFGWSTVKDLILEDTTITDDDRHKYQIAPLQKIEGNKHYYPVFEASRKSYTVTFMNDDILYYSIDVPYGSKLDDKDDNGNYCWMPKTEPADTDLYLFTGWNLPEDTTIRKVTTIYAVFTLNTEGWYTPDILQFAGDGESCYSINADNTLNLRNYINYTNSNARIKISETLNINGVDYQIRSLGGFYDYTGLIAIDLSDTEITTLARSIKPNGKGGYYTTLGCFGNCSALKVIKLPTSLIELELNTFNKCTSLSEILLPEGLETIGASAFEQCSNLSEITIPASVTTITDKAFFNNPQLTIKVASGSKNFKIDQGCLVDIKNKKLLQGSNTGAIPEEGVTSLGTHCFAYTSIESIVIPTNIKELSNIAFSYCSSLKNIIMHDDITTVGNTCFMSCANLRQIELPENLQEIKSYAFSQTGLKELVIPAKVKDLGNNSFGEIKSLTKVIFKALPTGTFDLAAFKNSGDATGITFKVPWSEETHINKFGKNFTWGANLKEIIYNYVEEN
jgi:hypothetical protein